MPESFKEQLSRVQQMAEDDGETWDLSDNDKAALKAVLAALAAAPSLREQQLEAALKALGRPHDGKLCFCGVSIGNPMVREHSIVCRSALTALEGQ